MIASASQLLLSCFLSFEGMYLIVTRVINSCSINFFVVYLYICNKSFSCMGICFILFGVGVCGIEPSTVAVSQFTFPIIAGRMPANSLRKIIYLVGNCSHDSWTNSIYCTPTCLSTLLFGEILY